MSAFLSTRRITSIETISVTASFHTRFIDDTCSERYLRNRSALTVNCFVIIHCLEISCNEDQITSMQHERFILYN